MKYLILQGKSLKRNLNTPDSPNIKNKVQHCKLLLRKKKRKKCIFILIGLLNQRACHPQQTNLELFLLESSQEMVQHGNYLTGNINHFGKRLWGTLKECWMCKRGKSHCGKRKKGEANTSTQSQHWNFKSAHVFPCGSQNVEMALIFGLKLYFTHKMNTEQWTRRTSGYFSHPEGKQAT